MDSPSKKKARNIPTVLFSLFPFGLNTLLSISNYRSDDEMGSRTYSSDSGMIDLSTEEEHVRTMAPWVRSDTSTLDTITFYNSVRETHALWEFSPPFSRIHNICPLSISWSYQHHTAKKPLHLYIFIFIFIFIYFVPPVARKI